MKPTPRTDAAIGRIDGVAYRADAHSFAPVIEECQTLERELSDALEREKALRQELAVNERNAERLLDTAMAVVARWDTPLWKEAPSTANFINSLRNAATAYLSGDELSAVLSAAPKPTDSGREG